MKRKLLLLAAACFTGAITTYAQQVAKGYVYEDVNRNGKKDKNEKGIAGIPVSNGVELAVTDSKGFYQVPVGDDNIIWVQKPSGYKVPLDTNNKPLFYYIHKPKGSPVHFASKGVAPTGPLPALINFALHQSTESTVFRSLIFGDPQPHSEEHVSYFDKGIVSDVAGVKGVEFGMSIGDIVDEMPELYAPYDASIARIGVPWYNLMGNHDINYEAAADSLSDETFEAHYGPVNFSFNHANTHFIVLDDVVYSARAGKRGSYVGGFRPDQLAFIRNDLKAVDTSKLVIVSFHIPLLGENVFRPDDKKQLFALLQHLPHVLIVSAHTHIQQQLFHDQSDGWQGKKPLHEFNVGTTCGDWYSGFPDEKGIPASTMADGTPKGYAFLNVSNNEYTIDYKLAGKPADYQMEITHPKLVVQNRHTPTDIIVNFFMGSADSKLECRIDNGKWSKMTQTARVDPNYQSMLYKWNQSEQPRTSRWPSEPGNSSHLWSIRIPSKLPLGEHSIEIKATDLFGRSFTQRSTYTIAAPTRDYP